MRTGVFITAFLFVALTCHVALATTQPFAEWLDGVRVEARQKGISEKTLHDALDGISPIERVVDLDRKQPEKKQTFAQYKTNVISAARIKRGREMMEKHADLLDRASKQYGVAPQYIVALWGIETSYGANFGSFDIVAALATLAWEGRRADFFRSELMHALRIIDEGHITHANMKGSWAGAMGHNQFMPSSFFNFAQDGNGDGRKDIWGTLPDVFASTANYLAKSGWRDGERWGREVRLPASFTESMVGLDNEKGRSLSSWARLGITLTNGSALPEVAGMTGYIVTPDGLAGPAYLVYDNYKVIMKWNRSTYFATSVGLIADAIAGSSAI